MKTLCRAVLRLLAVGQCVSAESGSLKRKGARLLAERNCELAYLPGRMELMQTAGTSSTTGACLVKLTEVRRGVKWDVEGSLCKALHPIRGPKKWEFPAWDTHAE